MGDEEEKREIKEIQETIIPKPTMNVKISEEEFFAALKKVAPGTNLRTALDNTVKTGKGALIVLGNEEVLPILDGGFKINCRFTPQKLVELSKMDGAIILDKDAKRISYVNVLLTPDSKIKTAETGTRHKAAERTAKQTGTLVIAISERKHDISFFYKNIKHILKNTDELLRKTNEHIQILERQRDLFDAAVSKLNISELRNYPNLQHALAVIQKGRLVQKMIGDIKKQIIELGTEGTLIKTRLKEIISGIEREINLVITDYTKLDLKKSRNLLESLSYDELLDQDNILKSLAYDEISQITVKGWRILSKTDLSEEEISKIIRQMGSLGKTLHSNIKEYVSILGETQGARAKEEIDKLKLYYGQ
jgi:diadenylate cyclase